MGPLITLIIAWACEDFIEPCIREALSNCDETIVCIAAHSDAMLNFEDNTYDIVKSIDGISSLDYNKRGHHSYIKADILNRMLDISKLFTKNSWILIKDVDEFYTQESYKYIRDIIESDMFNKILIKEKYFYINMQNYLLGEHNRLFKIEEENMDKNFRFVPTQKWLRTKGGVGVVPVDFGMFHYGMLTNPWAKFAFWKNEYPDKAQDNKTLWLDKIYRNYDLEYEEKWINENEKLFGVKSPWFSDSFKPNKNGRLFKYGGKHPDVIENSGLTHITDFRIKYGFFPNSN